MKTQYKDFFYAIDKAAIISTADLNGNITMANDKFCEISGYKRHELLGKNHRIVNSGVHSKYFFAQMWQTISTGNMWVGEVCNRAKDGNLYWVNSTVIPIIDESTNLVKEYISIRFDITEQKNTEDKLLKIQEKINCKLDDFFVTAPINLAELDM